MSRNRDYDIRFTSRAALIASVLVLVGSIAVKWIAYELDAQVPPQIECRR